MALTSFGFLSASIANKSEGAIQAEENLLVRSGAKRELKRTWNRSHCKCPNRDIARNQAHTQESEVANEVVDTEAPIIECAAIMQAPETNEVSASEASNAQLIASSSDTLDAFKLEKTASISDENCHDCKIIAIDSASELPQGKTLYLIAADEPTAKYREESSCCCKYQCVPSGSCCPNECDPCNDCCYAPDTCHDFEMGAEYLIFTSTIGTMYQRKALDTGYDSGFSVFLKSTFCNESDIGLYYSYIDNDGSQRFSSKEATTVEVPPGTTIDDQPVTSVGLGVMHNVRESLDTHLDVFDMIVGKSIPVWNNTNIRLQGGFSFNNFSSKYRFRDLTDIDLEVGVAVPIIGQTTISAGGFDVTAKLKESASFWAIGPKIGLDFDFGFTPCECRNQFRFLAKALYGLFYSDEKISGRVNTASNLLAILSLIESIPPETIAQLDVLIGDEARSKWSTSNNHSFYNNLNLDTSFQYQYLGNCLDVTFALGYRVLAFWFAEPTRFQKNQVDTVDSNGFLDQVLLPVVFNFLDLSVFPILIDDFSYMGPYVSLSIAF